MHRLIKATCAIAAEDIGKVRAERIAAKAQKRYEKLCRENASDSKALRAHTYTLKCLSTSGDTYGDMYSALGGMADSLGEDWGGLFGSLGGMMSDVINAEVEILGDYGAVLKSFELKAGDSVRITLSEGTALQITDGTCVLIAD